MSPMVGQVIDNVPLLLQLDAPRVHRTFPPMSVHLGRVGQFAIECVRV